VSIRPLNEFNALTDVPQAMQLRLLVMALAGNTAFSNAFTAWADKMGLSPEGRARKERQDVNRRGIFTPDRRAIETPLVDDVMRVEGRSCAA
jgi:hypothetical protein